MYIRKHMHDTLVMLVGLFVFICQRKLEELDQETQQTTYSGSPWDEMISTECNTIQPHMPTYVAYVEV